MTPIGSAPHAIACGIVSGLLKIAQKRDVIDSVEPVMDDGHFTNAVTITIDGTKFIIEVTEVG